MTDVPDITVYGAFWCPDCRRSKAFLGEHQIPYNWVDIEKDEAGERTVLEANQGRRRIHTEYSALSVLLAPGSRYRRVGVPGEEAYLGAGVHFCATCDGPFYRDGRWPSSAAAIAPQKRACFSRGSRAR